MIADSDVHVTPGYLEEVVVEALQGADTGLGDGGLLRPAGARPGSPPALGATQISHVFLPGALMARGTRTPGLPRRHHGPASGHVSLAIGGFHAIVGHLADDAVLGHLVGGLEG